MASRLRITLLIFAALMSLGAVPATRAGDAEESIWTALVLATNEKEPAEPPADIAKYAKKLKDIFGYNQYQLLGQRTEPMDSKQEHWLVPSQELFLRAESKLEKPGSYRLKLEVWEENKQLAQMDAKLKGQNLLFIRGPAYENGQLIIILMVQ